MRYLNARLGAWLVSLALLAYLILTTSPLSILRAGQLAAWWTVPALSLLFILVYLADSLAMWKTFGWVLCPLSFGEVLIARGTTYLLAIVNYTLGQGALVYFLHRTRGVPLLRGAGAMLLVMGINVLLLLLLSSWGLMFASEVPHELRVLVPVAYCGLALYLLLVNWKPRWLLSRPVVGILLAAGIAGHLKALAVRVPHVAAMVAFTSVSFHAFGIRVPIAEEILCLPVVYFIAVLPISVQGLGTAQLAMVHFFARYASTDIATGKAVVLACSLMSTAIALAVQAAIGLIFLRTRMSQSLRTSPPP